MSRRTPVAIWETGCATCPTPICPDDRIVLTDTGWAHQHCHTTPPARHESTEVCPTCWLYLPLSGVCEECEDNR